MIRAIGVCLALAACLSGCGGNTSWYFCSGGPDFCSVERPSDPPDEETDPDQSEEAVTTALVLAQRMPAAVQVGLENDGLRSLLDSSPDLVAGWLLAGSLAIVVDDGDVVFVTRFLDANRYWLTQTSTVVPNGGLLHAGLTLLAEISRQRDPLVAEKAQALGGHFTAPAVPGAAADPALTAAAGDLLRSRGGTGEAGDCCAEPVVTAAAVVLCDDPAVAAGGETTAPVCGSVRRWFADYLKGAQ